MTALTEELVSTTVITVRMQEWSVPSKVASFNSNGCYCSNQIMPTYSNYWQK